MQLSSALFFTNYNRLFLSKYYDKITITFVLCSVKGVFYEMRIVAYCRVSTEKEGQVNSMAMQKKFFTDYAKKQNYELVNIYADEGISGTKIKNRVQFQQLMKDAELGLFDMVVVKDISRLARNTVDFLQSIRKLKSLNIETVFLTANMTSLGDSEFVLTIFSALAQEESANTSKRIKFSKQINAQKGKVPNQVFGYDKIIGDYFNLNINQEEAEWVKKIFNWYTEDGYGALKISQMLNSMNIKTKRNKNWSQIAVSRILKNPLYTGTIVNGKQEISNFLTGERNSKSMDDWLLYDKPDLAIISKEQFSKAANIFAQRQVDFNINRKRQSNKYPLSTLIKCKECGCSFRRFERTYVNTYVRWICSGRNRNGVGSCENKCKIKEDELLSFIDDYFKIIVDQKQEIIRKIEKENQKIRKSCIDNQGATSSKLQFEISKKEKRYQKYLDMYADDLITRDELNFQTKNLKKEIGVLKKELSKQIGTDSIVNVESVKNTIELIEVISLSKEKTNQELKSVIDKIEVGKDGSIDIYIKNMRNIFNLKA